ncbi:MAG: hypothetical protein NUW21_08560 [Elusimicrobia bacterium]|nr:hypothetical protein [Elusimicrobiota bacterium]
MDPAPAPSRPLLWLWAAARALWITAFPLLCGAGMLLGASYEFGRGGRFTVAAVNSLVVAFFFLALAWFAARHTWRVVTGTKPALVVALKSEIASTAAVFLVCALLFAMIAPYFSGLFRRSHEGALKARLIELRAVVERHRAAHGGQAPPSLDGLGELPPLWGRYTEIPHPGAPGAVVVPLTTTADTGKWAYVISPSSPSLTGTVFIDCTHTDSQGSAWNSY